MLLDATEMSLPTSFDIALFSIKTILKQSLSQEREEQSFYWTYTHIWLTFLIVEKNWYLKKTIYYRRYVDDIFVLFRSRDHLIKFNDYLNKCHPNI